MEELEHGTKKKKKEKKKGNTYKNKILYSIWNLI